MKIQSLLFPKIEFQPDFELYFNESGSGNYYYFSDGLVISKSNSVSFNTYYNAFFVKPWLDNTLVRDFIYTIRAYGRCILSLCNIDKTGNDKVVFQSEYNFDGQEEVDINLSGDESGCFYIRITAIDEVKVIGGELSTKVTPLNKVNLGIVITHFNRSDYVVPAIRRIKSELLDDEEFGSCTNLYVIDNSKNIGLDNLYHGRIKIINNKNLGGSGGFTRGLLELKKNKLFSHCLFMDDDASCEIDSIKRTIAFLMYSGSDTAISGSLFRELETSRLVEKGAIFSGMAKPLSNNFNMSNQGDLILAAECNATPNYGAWWFFAFPINSVKYFPFPFFVRGDDIQFSLLNKFNITTLMGVGCFGDDFGLKSNPMTRYLDTRHTLVQNIAVEGLSYIDIVKNTGRFFFGALFGFNYDSARCASLAIQHVCLGVNFWSKNIDMSEIRKYINTNYNSEKMVDISLEELDILSFPICEESRVRKLVRIFTLQGFLLPKIMLRKKILLQPKHSSVELRATFRASKILHYYAPYKKGYISKYDRIRFFKELFFYLKQLIKLRKELKSLRQEYKLGLNAYTSEEFWKGIYND
ncbi:glycosyltransferase family 2 protein [Vibrio sp. WJH972]